MEGGGPRIDAGVFQHAIGNPDSYPTRSQRNALLAGGGLQTSLAAVGQGAGSTELGIGRTRLVVDRLPAGVTTLFLASRTAGATPVMGSVGTLCLGGAIGRYVGPGQIQNSGTDGTFGLDLDLNQIPQPNGAVAVQSGEIWNFQAWYRDAVGGSATSNLPWPRRRCA